MKFPDMSEEERMAALEKAAAVRTERARIKGRLKTGEVTVAGLLESVGDPVVSGLRVRDVLSSLPGYGKARTDALMRELKIDESRRLGGLGTRQRKALADALGRAME